MPEIAMPSAEAELLRLVENGDMLGYLTLRWYREAILICDVFVLAEERGAGCGSELLDMAITVAEEFGMDLVLRVAGSGAPNTLDDEQLGQWYRRYGFDTHPEWDEPTVLIRRAHAE